MTASVVAAPFALGAQPAAAAITLVQKGVEASANGRTIAATLPAPTAAGNLLVASIEDGGTGCGNDNFTAPSGWVKAAHTCRGSTGPLELWYLPNAPAGVTSVTFDMGTANAKSQAQLSEWAGVSTSSPLDQTGTQYTSTAAATLGVATSGNVARSGELAVTAFDTSSGLTTFTPGTGWNALSADPSNGFDSDYRINPPSGAPLTENPVSSPQTVWAGAIATFLPACTGGSLAMTTNPTLTFPAVTLNAYNRTATATLALSADDETGSGSGWNLNATSTTFDDGSGDTLPTTATTITAASAGAATGNCSMPAANVTYPLTLPAGSTPPTAVRLYNATAATGGGPTNLSLTTSLAVPANARPGSYSSTWTLTLSSGP